MAITRKVVPAKKPEVKKEPEKKTPVATRTTTKPTTKPVVKPDYSAKLKGRREEATKSRNSGGVQYKVIDTSSIDVEREKLFWKPKAGINQIDIVPFLITQDWYKDLLTRQGRPLMREIGDPETKLEIPVHRGVGAVGKQFICLKKAFGKKCPICEEIETLDDDDLKKKLKPSWRVFYDVIDSNGSGDVQIFETSQFNFDKELLDEAASISTEQGLEEVLPFDDPESGYSIKFRATEESIGKDGKYFKFKKFDFIERDEQIGWKIVESSYALDSLLLIPTYDEVQKAFLELSDDDVEEEKPEVEEEIIDEAPAEEEETEEQEVIEEEPEEEEKPAPKRERKAAAPSKSKCPFKHKFGTDCNQKEDCSSCSDDDFEACSAEQDRLKK